MKAHYRTRNGRIVFEVEGDTQKALFKSIAELAEVFECDETCGCCGSHDIRPRVRTIDDNDYYEFLCASCNAQLSFGQHKKGGTLFPKRSDGEGLILANRGWRQFRSTKQLDGEPKC